MDNSGSNIVQLDNKKYQQQRRRQRRRLLAAFSCAVVLVTALAMMLPALSMSTDTATPEAGIFLSKQSERAEGQDESDEASSKAAATPEKAANDQTEAVSKAAEDKSEEEPAAADSEQAAETVQPKAKDEAQSDSDEQAASDNDSAGAAAKQEASGDAEAKDSKDSKADGEDKNSKDSAKADSAEQTFQKDFVDDKGTVVFSVMATAPEGALPEDAQMKAKSIAADEVSDAADQAIQDAADLVAQGTAKTTAQKQAAKRVDDTVTNIQAVDISFTDAKGSKVQPEAPITVSLASPKVVEFASEGGDEPLVVHVDGKGNPGVVDTLTKKQQKKRDIAPADDKLVFETEDADVYALVYTMDAATAAKLQKTVITASGEAYEVSVTYDQSAGIPEGADLSVEELAGGTDAFDSYAANAEEALGMEEGSAGYIRLFDIKIVDAQGNKLQPADGATVDVRIQLADSESESLSVVHFQDGRNAGEVVESSTESAPDGQAVSFEAESFSVYAVVDEGQGGDNARMTVNFWNGDTEIATMYVKNADDTDAVIEQILYDPGVEIPSGYSFLGWTTDQNYTANSDRMTISDIRDSVKALANADRIKEGDSVDYYAALYKVVDVTYLGDQGVSLGTDSFLRTPNDPESFSYTVNMSYSPDATHNFEGWLVHEGSSHISGYTEGAVYPNETQITIDGSVTFSVSAPEGQWLVFHENGRGATYNAPQFVKSGEVTQPPALEMKRNGYTFGGWYTDEACTAGNEFTFGGQIADRTDIYAKWTKNTTATYTVLIWKQNVNDAKDAADSAKTYDFAESITLSGTVDSIINTVTATGTGNNRYARVNGVSKQYAGFHLNTYDTNVTINTEGNSVLNVYYDRNLVTFTFQYRDYAYTATTSNNGTQYGQLADGSYVRIYQRQGYTGWWYDSTPNAQYYTWVQYTGTRYTRSNSQSWITQETMTGLYGSSLASNGYTWPTNRWWYDSYSSGMGGYSGSGTRTTFLDAFKLSNDADSQTFYGFTGTGSNQVYFYKRNPDNNNYELANDVTTGNGTFYISDKYNGYKTVSYSTNDSTWTNLGDKDSNGYYASVSSYSNLYIRYDPLQYSILYMDGVYVDGNNNPVAGYSSRGELNHADGITFESSTTSYNKGGVNYYEPTYDGFVFEGWYIDDQCTQPYTFTTMPEGITVYAKWRQVQYRVFLHPNADTDSTLNWGSANQEMNFRVAYMDSVSLPFGTRNGYEFVGWFSDKACTIPFSSDTKLTDASTVAYDKTADKTDPMDKWGNIGDNPSNSDINRSWVNKKLDLYGRWRKVIDGAEGIGIVYDLNGGTGNVQDNRLYKDSAQAVAQNAPTAPENKVFDHWVVQTYNSATGRYEDTDVTVYLGGNFTVDKDLTKVEVTKWKSSKDSSAQTQAQDPAAVYSGTDTITGPAGFPYISEASYTIQLKAVYIDAGEKTPTYIDWFKNDQDPSQLLHEDKDLQINEAVGIQPAPTREGYRFLGWARESEYTMVDGHPTGDKITYVGKKDLFLKYDESTGKYQAKNGSGEWVDVTQVAADENMPYHALYAQWEKTYTVTVKKVVDSAVDTDKTKTFTFTPSTTLDKDETTFTLSDGGTKSYSGINKGSVVSVSEEPDALFTTTATVTPTSTTDGTAIPENEQESTIYNAGSDYTVNSDVTITFTNTRKTGTLEVKKKTNPADIAPNGMTIPVTVQNNTTHKYLQSANEISFGDDPVQISVLVADGLAIEGLPIGEYTVAEVLGEDNANVAIEGYRYDGNIIVYVDADDEAIATGIVSADATTTATVTNNYTKLVDVVVKKTLVDNTATAGTKAFSFAATLTEDEEDISDQLGTIEEGKTSFEFALTPSASKPATWRFEDIPVGAVLSVVEAADSDYTTTIKVGGTDSSEGTLTVGDVAAANIIEFTNTRKTVNIVIKKIDAETKDPLPGATFQLTRKVDGSTAYENYGEPFIIDGDEALVTKELPSGDYMLTETGVPDGYIVTHDTTFTVNAEAGATEIITGVEGDAEVGGTNKTELTVKNTPGKPLPHTGGFGSESAYVLGALLVLGACAVLLRRARRNEA